MGLKNTTLYNHRMPKKNIDYNKTMIYKFVCRDTNVNDLYVGNTTDWRTRKSTHKSACCNEKSKDHNLKIYKTIRGNGGWDNWDMVLVEKHPCEDGIEARKREEYWRKHLMAMMNSSRAYRSVEDLKDDRKIYREKYKDTITKYINGWRKNNQEKIKEYYITHKEELGKRISCPLCKLEMNRSSLLRHAKRQHPPSILCSLSPVSQASSPSLLPCPVNPP